MGNLSVPSSEVKNPRRLAVISYRRFGTTYRSHLQGPLKMGPISCPETSVRNYHYLLRNSPEERSSQIWLKSVDRCVLHFCLNSDNIRDTLWRRTLACHEFVSHLTHCIIVGADVLRIFVVRNKTGANVLRKATHRISKHLVCSSLACLQPVCIVLLTAMVIRRFLYIFGHLAVTNIRLHTSTW